MQRAIRFYRDGLGLPLRFESPGWTEFATGSCNLALHKAAEESVTPAGPDHFPAGHCHVGFTVTDLDEFHDRMRKLNTKCLQEPKTTDFGRLAVYADPDGLPVSVMQAASSEASTT
jgi:lactoylglutathione lyase